MEPMIADGILFGGGIVVGLGVGWALGRGSRRASGSDSSRRNSLMGSPRNDGSAPTPSAGIDAEVRILAAAGHKIEAIKLLREQTGMGLREAKEAVERLR